MGIWPGPGNCTAAPQQYVQSRLKTFYEKVHKGSPDKVHQHKIKVLRHDFLPIAVERAVALPEIDAAIDIQAHMEDKGETIAADAVTDLLTVYGITIHFIRENHRLRKQEAAEKAARIIYYPE